MNVTGNLFVNGSSSYINVATFQTVDSLIELASNNTSDSVDIGFYGQYVSSGTKFTGLVRSASSNYTLFQGISTNPTSNSIGAISFANYGTLNANIAAGQITSSQPIPVTSGGTGVTTSTGSGNNVLSTSPTLVTPALGTPSSVTLTSATGLPLSTGVTGTLAVGNGGTGVTTSTGSGSVVLSTSPTLTTPILGTPQSGNLSNCTFPTLNQNTTGTAALASGLTGGPSITVSGITSAGDITTYRTSNATTGVLYLGTGGTRYLFYDGSNYVMPGAGLYVNGSTVVTNNSGTYSINITGSAGSAGSASYASTAGSASYASTASSNFSFSNYGYGMLGVYSSTRYQGIFAMSGSYVLPADGTSTGNLYGLCWSYPGGQGGPSGNLDSHGLLVLINGEFGSAMSYSIKAHSNITAYSDERLKKNWRSMPSNYVEELAKVKNGIYDRTDNEITQVGVSAQSLQKLLPEAVTEATDDMKTLSVNYGAAALSSSVELAKEIVDLKSRISELEKLIAKLM